MMRAIGPRLPILATIALALSQVPARADDIVYLETADWIPTARVLAIPTAYVSSTPYVIPTSYVFPTSYSTAYVTETSVLTPTSYLAPSYYETTLRRRGLFGRRLEATTRAVYDAGYIPTTAYYPTTYFYPTTYTTRSPLVVDRAVVPTEFLVETSATSSACCGGGEIVVADSTVRTFPSDQGTTSRRSEANTDRPRRQPTVESDAEDDIDSSVPSLPERESDSAAGQKSGGNAPSPPKPQQPTREQSSAARPEPSNVQPKQPTTTPKAIESSPEKSGGSQTPEKSTLPKDNDEPPTAPAEGDELQSADPKPTTLRRESRKPVTPSLRLESRNVLFGRVKAHDTREPEEGVRVTISSKTNAYDDRQALSDAFGRFAVRLPDGDWTVKVTMPSGRVYAVSEITVSQGQITDDSGRDIPSLTITR